MNRYKIKKQSSGFTMIEIMVVVVIVAILAAIAVPTYVRYVESARASEAKSVIGNIDNAAITDDGPGIEITLEPSLVAALTIL